MKVILQKDVKDLGKVGDVVNVALGFARNYLFPRKLAEMATEKKVKQWTHLQKVAEVKRKKVVSERQLVIDKINGISLNFKMQAGESDKLFGSVGPVEISKELDKQGYSIDRRDIELPEVIKVLGQHKAHVILGDGLKAEIIISVEKA